MSINVDSNYTHDVVSALNDQGLSNGWAYFHIKDGQVVDSQKAADAQQAYQKLFEAVAKHYNFQRFSEITPYIAVYQDADWPNEYGNTDGTMHVILDKAKQQLQYVSDHRDKNHSDVWMADNRNWADVLYRIDWVGSLGQQHVAEA